MAAKTNAAKPATAETSFNNIVTLVASLKDLIKDGSVRIMTGPFGSALHAHEYIDCGVPVVPAEAICDDGRLDPSTFPRISKAKAEELSRYLLQEGDIVFARRGAQACGKSALVRSGHSGSISGTGLISLRVINRDRINNEYLAIALRSQESKDWLMHHAIGATMPNLNSSVIASLPLNLPTMRDQNAIAEIIQSLDDKIELNRRMNTTLEAMARALFQSWFVDFDPVRAKLDGRLPVGMDAEAAALFPDTFQDSALGHIPQGWTATTLGDACKQGGGNVQTGPFGTQLHAADYVDEGIPSIMPSDLRDNRIDVSSISRIREHDAERLSLYRVQKGDVIYSRRGDVERRALIRTNEEGWLCGTGCLRVRFGQFGLNPFFGASYLGSLESRAWVVRHAVGATMPNLNTSILGALPMIVPPQKLQERFAKIVGSWDERGTIALEQSRTLATLRDTLLPKLLSGELSVAGASATLAAL